jgi:hypothetical protein
LIESVPKVDPGTRPWADSYSWKVPTPPANVGKCYVKVVAYSGNMVVGSDRSAKPFTIEGVKLIQPNGGEVLKVDTPYTIAWEINGTKSDVTKVNLYYTTNGGASYVLIDSIPKTDPGTRPWLDSYPWTVPTPSTNMTNCYVKVVAYSGSTVVGSDRSEKPFTIARVKLTKPNGGDFVPAGNVYGIEGMINGPKSPVTSLNLYYSTDGGSSYALIETWSLGTGLTPPFSFGWYKAWPTLPGTRTNCYAKVVAYSGNTVVGSDASDKPFTIGVVKLLEPNGGEVYESGTSYPVKWEIYGTKNPVAAVRLYYSMDGGTTWSLITTLDGILRSYNWIPLAQTTKTKCKVKVAITDTKGVTSSDISDGYFTIQP